MGLLILNQLRLRLTNQSKYPSYYWVAMANPEATHAKRRKMVFMPRRYKQIGGYYDKTRVNWACLDSRPLQDAAVVVQRIQKCHGDAWQRNGSWALELASSICEKKSMPSAAN